MRILFALAGLHRVDRGAEIAFMAIASELVRAGHQVTLIGSGPSRPGQGYRYLRAKAIARERFERFPKVPLFRGDTVWEEASFIPGLLSTYQPSDYDVTLTCSYPFTNWALRRPMAGARRPPHVFVTQNGDWPAFARNAEYRWFGCEGLVCINPDHAERNADRWRTALIPNGVDLERFTPGLGDRARFGLDPQRSVVLMVSAMIASKNIDEGIRAVSQLPEATLVVAGDGPLRASLHALAEELMPGRFRQVQVPSADMPPLYRCADAFLHLSRDESFGNVYVEALACGLPVVAWDLPRTRWIVGDAAKLAARDDSGMLVEQLRNAIGTGPSTLGQAAQVERFAWPTVAKQYESFLGEVIGGPA